MQTLCRMKAVVVGFAFEAVSAEAYVSLHTHIVSEPEIHDPIMMKRMISKYRRCDTGRTASLRYSECCFMVLLRLFHQSHVRRVLSRF